MKRRPRTADSPRRGVAMLVTLIFLALFACMAAAVAASVNMKLTLLRNRVNAEQAGALAEAGLQLTRQALGGLDVPDTHDPADLHLAVADRLQSVWAPSSMFTGGEVLAMPGSVVVPPLALSHGGGLSGTVEIEVAAAGGAADEPPVTIRSTGNVNGASRTVTYTMTVQRAGGALFDYGIASKSPIRMTGNARVSGANQPSEASVLSATYSMPQAIKLTGNCSISGDVGVCNPDGQIQKSGNVVIGGDETFGAPEPDWPEVDVGVFRPYAVNVRSSGGSGNLVLSNIRIPANTNPTFAGNITIYGVVYIEAPNRVTFSGNTNVIGCIVCETPAVENLNANRIHFTGNMSTSGVENLPAGPQYDGLRELTGSFLLAPGYSTKFTGNFGTVNGCMVASEFQFSGNAGGTVVGGIVNLSDSTFKMTGNAHLVIDRDNADDNPAGITTRLQLVCVTGSYEE